MSTLALITETELALSAVSAFAEWLKANPDASPRHVIHQAGVIAAVTFDGGASQLAISELLLDHWWKQLPPVECR